MIALVAFALVFQGVAVAASNSHWSPFGTAVWEAGAGNPGYGLTTTSSPSGTYGGIQLNNPPKHPNSITALSFDFNANQTGASGGSPRLVVEFSDGGNGQLRPLSWVAGVWATENGMTTLTDWDNAGGTCGFAYGTSWAAIMACHPGTRVTAIFAVNDSGWVYPPAGEQVILDNITVNDAVASGPKSQ